jgi:peptidoglycan-N-acetylglucosamine deacetylase
LAACTIDTSDYLFNRAYAVATENRDVTMAARLRGAYLKYSGDEIDYYAGLNKQVIGYEPPEVMLLHDNLLNSEVLDEILGLFEARGYRFVRLHEAQSDAAYKIPDTYITSYGPMWGYRWAREHGIKVDGRLEPEVPDWVTRYKERK